MDGQEALIAGRYRLRNRIGAGGMGVVWEAWDERLHRAVALKLLHRAPGLDEEQANLANLRVMREARITARLHHRYAVPVFDVIEHEGQACLVMPFLSSMTLAAVLREAGPLSVAEVAKVGSQVASALAAAHQAGIVHRDVKPGNVLITEDGTALISDFGIAHALGEATLTATGLIHGTPAYLAPEVARGNEATYASDVFSLGATLYDALEGAPPFGTDQNSIALLHRIAAGHVEPPKSAGSLTPILQQALDPDPQSRPTMAAVAADLWSLAHASEGPVGQQVSTSGASPEPPSEGVTPSEDTTPSEDATPSEEPIATPPSPPPAAEDPSPLIGATGEITDQNPPRSETTPPRITQQYSPAAPTRRRRTLVALLVAAVVLVGGTTAALLLEQHQAAQHHATAGGPNVPTSHSTASTATRTSSQASPASPAAGSAPSTAGSSTSPAPSRPSPTPSAHPTVRGTPTARELAHAIRSYYALMPDDTDAAWTRMTASYRSNHAGGREAYENFWKPIRRVEVSNVSGRPPDGAIATITYFYRDGRVVRERTTYRLADQRGTLKISDSDVLSSTTS